MPIDKTWFQNRLQDLGVSQRQLSQQLAKNPNTISLVLAGKRNLTHEEVGALARLLETTPDEVLKRMGAEPIALHRDSTVEFFGYVDELGRVDLDGVRPRSTAPAPPNVTANTRAIGMLSLDGGSPQHGWIYYADFPSRERPVDADSLNALCVVEIGDKTGKYLGVVRRGRERGIYDLINPFTGKPIVEGVALRNANPVTWIKTA